MKKLRTWDIKLLAQGYATGRDRSHRGQAVMLVINRRDCSLYEEVSDENVLRVKTDGAVEMNTFSSDFKGSMCVFKKPLDFNEIIKYLKHLLKRGAWVAQ